MSFGNRIYLFLDIECPQNSNQNNNINELHLYLWVGHPENCPKQLLISASSLINLCSVTSFQKIPNLSNLWWSTWNICQISKAAGSQIQHKKQNKLKSCVFVKEKINYTDLGIAAASQKTGNKYVTEKCKLQWGILVMLWSIQDNRWQRVSQENFNELLINVRDSELNCWKRWKSHGRLYDGKHSTQLMETNYSLTPAQVLLYLR